MADTQKLEILVKVNKDTHQLEVVGTEFDKLSNQIQHTNQSINQSDKSFFNLKNTLTGLGVYLGGQQIINFFKDAIKEAEEENEALRRLSFALESNKISWLKNKDAVQDWATEIQKTTKFSDTEAYETLGHLLRVTGDLNSAFKLSQVAMGLSSASGKDLSSVLHTLAGSLVGSMMGLAHLKTEFSNYLPVTENVSELMNSLYRQFGNVAKAENGLTKETKIVENQFKDFKETVGRDLIPILQDLLPIIKFLTSSLSLLWTTLATTMSKTMTGISALWSVVGNTMILNFKGVQDAILSANETIKKDNERLANELTRIFAQSNKEYQNIIDDKKQINIKLTKDLVSDEKENAKKREEISEELTSRKKELSLLLTEFEKGEFEKRKKQAEIERDEILNNALATNEQKVIATELFEQTITQIVREENEKRKSDTLESALFLSDELSTVFVDAFQTMKTEGLDFTESMKRAFAKMADNLVAEAVRVIAQWIIVNVLTGGAGMGLSAIAGGGGTILGAALKAVGLQEGGIVTQPTFAVLGEGGKKEAVIPLDNSFEGNGIGNKYTINLNINTLDPSTIDRRSLSNIAYVLTQEIEKQKGR